MTMYPTYTTYTILPYHYRSLTFCFSLCRGNGFLYHHYKTKIRCNPLLHKGLAIMCALYGEEEVLLLI